MTSSIAGRVGFSFSVFLMLGLVSSCGNLIKGMGSLGSASNASSGSSTGGGGGGSTPAQKVLQGYELNTIRALSVSRVIFPGYTGPLIQVKAIGAGQVADIGATANGSLDLVALMAFSVLHNEDIRISRIYDQRNLALNPTLKGDRYGYSDTQMPVIVSHSFDGVNHTRVTQINPSTGRIAARFSSALHRLATDPGFLPAGTYDIHLVFRSENAKSIFYIAGLNQYAFKMNPTYTTRADSNSLGTVVFRNWDVSSASFLIDAAPTSIDLSNYSQSSISAVLTQGAGNQFKVFSMMNSSPDSFFGNKADFGGYKNYSPGDNYDFLGYYEEEVITSPLGTSASVDLASRLKN